MAARRSALLSFHEPVRDWFDRSFSAPTAAQELAWPLIQSGESALVLAPTGSGKTLAAFLSAIDRLLFEPVPERQERCRVLYVSPLKALAVDVERNLRAPLVGVARSAERLGQAYHMPEIALRTGDTPTKERVQFASRPADILITTPESLYLLLTTQARASLRSVRCVIIDELHALLPTKRGAHLALSLERLERLRGARLQRIGLSATLHPIDEATRFLGGAAEGIGEGGALRPRPVLVADGRSKKRLELTVEVPVEDMARPAAALEAATAPAPAKATAPRKAPAEAPPSDDDIPSGPAAGAGAQRDRMSIWPAMHPLLLQLIRAHRSTLIFVNSRRLAERLAGALNELAGEEIVRAHHGSIAREKRAQIEDELKAGRLPALVATSSLELGIDMGAIDLVVQVEAPPSVASGLQRVGRAGHHLGAASQGVILPKYRGDLLACAALCARMIDGEVEALRYPRSPLDVLCQQVVAMVGTPGEEEWTVDELFACVRRAAPFTELSRPLLESVLDLLSGRYPSDEFAELRPRLTWDRLTGALRARAGARQIAISSGGTIPDRGYFGVYLAGSGAEQKVGRPASGRVGELDEEMVLESRPGETFILGASTWRIEEITHDKVLVSPAPGEPGKMPFWRGEQAGRPLEFGRAIGALCRALRELPRAEALALLTGRHCLTPRAAENLLDYIEEQSREGGAGGAVPDDRTIIAERHIDELGDHRLCLLSPFGSQVHGPLALCIEALCRERAGADANFQMDLLWTDDGVIARFPGGVEPPPLAELLPDPDELEDLLARQLGGSALFAARFREAAARALLLPRRYPGQRTSLWQQRRRAADLLRAASRFPSFPIVLEAYRECLRDVFDVPALRELLLDLRRRKVRLLEVHTARPSPFASALLFGYAASFLYEGDAPLAERRAQALLVDPQRLRELIGSAELRELIDEEALSQLERQLQHLLPERRARHADGAHDLLLRLGDLTADELAARCEPGAGAAHLAQLLRERRAITLTIAGQERVVAAEDAGRFRDALGVPPPPGLPAAFLEHVADPLGDLVARYARSHGPFTAQDVAARLGLGPGAVRPALLALQKTGRLIEGAFRPGGQGAELCDAEVLRQLRQRSLARLRREIEPVEGSALGRLYLAWHGVGSKRRGPEALLEVIEQLQGLALPASALEAEILPARLGRFEPHDLDNLLASGSVLWVGAEALGEHDGRIRLYLAEHAPLLLPPAPAPAEGEGPLREKIRAHLRARGASFFPQLLAACGGAFSQAVLDALWDLVWAGEVTNDTLQPLRAYQHPQRRRAGRPLTLGGASGLGRLGASSYGPTPREASGRWALVESLFATPPSPTERAQALCRQILGRHGVLTREALGIEDVPGGFSAIYPVLRALEDAGQIRRGYFVAGRGAAQFALPGATERLRLLRDSEEAPQAVVLAAVDPASPYGAALPWPALGEDGGRRPQRAAGALVVLVDGAPAAWVARSEQQLLTFLDQVPERDSKDVALAVARTLAALVDSGRRRVLLIKEIDGRPTAQSPLAPALVEAGFRPGAQGYMRRAEAPAAAQLGRGRRGLL